MIRRRGLLAGGGAATVLALLIAPIDTHFANRLSSALWDFGHVPGFALLSYLVLDTAQQRGSSSQFRTFAASIAALTLVAVGTELMQGQMGRSFSAEDIGRDLAGMLAGVAAWLTSERSAWPAALMTALPAIAAVAFYSTYPIAVAADTLAAKRAFPTLADFCEPRQRLRFVNSSNMRIEHAAGHCIASVRLGGGRYTGFNLAHFPRDWSGYSGVEISIFNPSAEPLRLTCRLHDRWHNDRYDDRLNASYALPSGDSIVTLSLAEAQRAPASREMDLSAIGGLLCFTTLEESRLIWVRSISLALDDHNLP